MRTDGLEERYDGYLSLYTWLGLSTFPSADSSGIEACKLFIEIIQLLNQFFLRQFIFLAA